MSFPNLHLPSHSASQPASPHDYCLNIPLHSAPTFTVQAANWSPQPRSTLVSHAPSALSQRGLSKMQARSHAPGEEIHYHSLLLPGYSTGSFPGHTAPCSGFLQLHPLPFPTSSAILNTSAPYPVHHLSDLQLSTFVHLTDTYSAPTRQPGPSHMQ